VERRPELRVSDRDRQDAAGRLLVAHSEGRLDLAEYDARVAQAYAAVTYADLDRLFVDLPAPESAAQPRPAPLAERAVPAAPAITAGLPTALKVLWTIWLSCMLANLAAWLVASLSSHDVLYFWPIWLAIPAVALLGVTLGVSGGRRR
jgi:hypothetical protein